MFEVIPAIDIKDGQCVRLIQGQMDQVTVYHRNPGDVAVHWANAGATRIHVVDLDGAVQGEPRNRRPITEIATRVHAKVQVGGGIRDLGTIDAYLDMGIDRVILGTAALENPSLVERACAKHPGRIVVGIDARGGRVAVRGWAETSAMQAIDLAQQLGSVGVAAIIYTDIARDGMLSGPNLEATASLAAESPVPIIASGGIRSIEDLRALRAISGCVGAIVGKALYTGTIEFPEALQLQSIA